MITVIQARGRASRWCEIAYASPEVAQSTSATMQREMNGQAPALAIIVS